MTNDGQLPHLGSRNAPVNYIKSWRPHTRRPNLLLHKLCPAQVFTLDFWHRVTSFLQKVVSYLSGGAPCKICPSYYGICLGY